MAGVGLWLAWAYFAHWLLALRLRDGDDPAASVMLRLVRLYAALFHRARFMGLESLKQRDPQRPLVIVANHTAGVDPLLIQAALAFEVRWVMAQDMRVERFEWFWEFARIIFVDREAGEGSGLREALRHVKSGGVLGLFPEGAIERPPRMLLPFKEGIGLLIARSRALVLPVVIDGTPFASTAWGSLMMFSRSRLRFLSMIDFAAERTKAGEIAPALQRVFERATGWPVNDHPPKYENGRWWYVDESGVYRPED